MTEETFVKVSHAQRADGTGERWSQADVVGTRNAFDNGESRAQEVVAYDNPPQDSRITPCDGAFGTLPKQLGKGGGNAPFVQQPNHYHYAVRRITPIEGERLQGFADNWTRPCFTDAQLADDALVDQFVEIHRKWAAINGNADAKPKSREAIRKWMRTISSPSCPDGPRYKAIGNSMSVNVMAWIGERIADADANGGVCRE